MIIVRCDERKRASWDEYFMAIACEVEERKPKVLRLYNEMVNALAGKNGECVVGNISQRASN